MAANKCRSSLVRDPSSVRSRFENPTVESDTGSDPSGDARNLGSDDRGRRETDYASRRARNLFDEGKVASRRSRDTFHTPGETSETHGQYKSESSSEAMSAYM